MGSGAATQAILIDRYLY